MILNDFNEETTKLEKFYGKKLEDFERDIWYKELKNMPLKRYQQIIQKLFTENKFMPKLADIVALNKELPYETKKENEKVECNICHGNGFILYTRIVKDMPYEFVARCDCQNGNPYKYDDGKFYMPSVNQLGI